MKHDTAVSWELFGMRAVRKGDFKLLWLPEPYGTGDWQLYDLDKVPGELNDLSAHYPKLQYRNDRDLESLLARNRGHSAITPHFLNGTGRLLLLTASCHCGAVRLEIARKPRKTVGVQLFNMP